MNIKYFGYVILAFLTICLAVSCDKDSEYYYEGQAASKNALVKGFSLKGKPINRQDTIAYGVLENTKFVVDHRRGLIYNADSLPYQTRLGKFKPTIELISDMASVKVVYRDTVVAWNSESADSIDFSKDVTLRILPAAGDGSPKEYKVNLNVHKYDPDTLPWMRIASLPIAANVQVKTVAANDQLIVYAVIGNQIKMYSTPRTEVSWSTAVNTTLPVNTRLSSITFWGGKLLAVSEDGKSYVAEASSPATWNVVENGVKVHGILGVLPAEEEEQDKLLVMVEVEKDKVYRVGETKDFSSVEIIEQIIGFADPVLPIDELFPSHDYTSATKFNRKDLSDNIMVVAGGVDIKGNATSDVWMFRLNKDNVLEISPFKYSQTNKPFDVSNDFKVFSYDNQIYAATGNVLYTSKWGMKWTVAPDKQQFTASIETSQNQSIAIDEDSYIWIVGSKEQAGRVWKGRLNRLYNKNEKLN